MSEFIVSNYTRARIINGISEHFMNQGRDFPWRNTSDPYVILVTEVMLRKTTAKKLNYCWSKFFKEYPEVISLANARPKDIENIIFPLGLQKQRAKDLKKIGSLLIKIYRGSVPDNYEKLIKLHGVGNYSANATLCFAFEKIVPIIDVNVARLYSRLFNRKFKRDIYNDRELYELASVISPKRKSKIREFNYGLLDFGAQVCRATSPKCTECVFNKFCQFPGT